MCLCCVLCVVCEREREGGEKKGGKRRVKWRREQAYKEKKPEIAARIKDLSSRNESLAADVTRLTGELLAAKEAAVANVTRATLFAIFDAEGVLCAPAVGREAKRRECGLASLARYVQCAARGAGAIARGARGCARTGKLPAACPSRLQTSLLTSFAAQMMKYRVEAEVNESKLEGATKDVNEQALQLQTLKNQTEVPSFAGAAVDERSLMHFLTGA